jgi:hypothetical protein
MGFNKRFVKKEMILGNVDNIPYVCRLVNADALIIDAWSDKFFKNFDFKWEKYQELREKLNTDVQFWSMHDKTLEHENYPKLKSLSNVLLNLKTNPSWTDILLVSDILKDIDMVFLEKLNPPKEIAGKFKELVPYHIKLIEDYYG